MISSSGTAYAAATSARIGWPKNCSSCVVTTVKRAGMAISAGEPNSAIASRNVTIAPPRMAGSAIGSVTRNVVRRMPAPRMLAASSISEETRSSAAVVKMNR